MGSKGENISMYAVLDVHQVDPINITEQKKRLTFGQLMTALSWLSGK